MSFSLASFDLRGFEADAADLEAAALALPLEGVLRGG